ncbi:MAG: tryptophan--tRNA ligase [Clostridia bacterium]|nr:tryptophan--tRNA ligase [Clostridia bacterium]
MENIQPEKRKIALSGIQPSGIFTLGNYIGAVRNWKELQDSYDCLFMIANMHTITVRQDPKVFKENTYKAFANLLAAGLDPEKNILFVQSQVPAHAELGWILDCYTMFGELSRMTQFKDKSAKNSDNINAGLFTYPALMAADILLYKADIVPVGLDQKQHVEIARVIANRFNGIYGNVFTVPEPVISKSGAKIMSLADPEHKMSKSDPNPNACISVSDKPEDILRKFKRAVTDSQATIKRGEGRHGINNLIEIYSIAAGITPEQVEAEFEGKGYGDFKVAVAEAVIEMLRPFREKTEDLLKNKDYLDALCKQGAERAAHLAERTMSKVYKKIGMFR